MHKNTLFVHAMNVVQIASRLMIKDRRSSHQGCFDDGSRSLELGSKNDAVSLPEDCRLDRRCLRQASKLRIPGLGACNDRGALQEAPEPGGFRTTTNVGVRHRLCSWEDKFSRRQIVFSAHDDGGPVRRIRCRREHRPRKARAIEKAIGVGPFDPQWTLPSLVEKNPLFWMAKVNGLLVDLRDMPREIQEIAFQDRLIPYIPADRKERS